MANGRRDTNDERGPVLETCARRARGWAFRGSRELGRTSEIVTDVVMFDISSPIVLALGWSASVARCACYAANLYNHSPMARQTHSGERRITTPSAFFSRPDVGLPGASAMTV